jgi:uncharacterized protein with FMN-binding domain
MKKKIIILVSVILATLLASLLFMVIIPEQKYEAIRNMKIDSVDLTKIEDGEYKGQYTYGHYTYKVEVNMKDHKITDISVDNGGKSKQSKMAEGVTDKIISQQKIDVDVVSGATTTSKAILKAVENALSKNEKVR